MRNERRNTVDENLVFVDGSIEIVVEADSRLCENRGIVDAIDRSGGVKMVRVDWSWVGAKVWWWLAARRISNCKTNHITENGNRKEHKRWLCIREGDSGGSRCGAAEDTSA